MRRRLDFQFPPVLLLSVTDACNYQCKGCYAVGHEKGHEMDVALVERLVREAAAHGTNYFVLLGGEPFLWPHLLPVLQSHPEAWFQIYTNGSKIDRGTAAELRKKANVQVMISLEGLRGHTDARRGPGAYDNCLMAMDNLRLERVPFGVGVTCYRSNLAEVVSDAFVEEMLSRGCLFIWYFWYMPYGYLPEFEEVLTSEDRAVLRDGIIRIRNSYPVIAADQIADCGAVGGCTARAGLALHVTASGLVEPCAQMHFSDASVG
jgi:MoaA/NifB/PqqE/SkfB family radical SAM enzyme